MNSSQARLHSKLIGRYDCCHLIIYYDNCVWFENRCDENNLTLHLIFHSRRMEKPIQLGDVFIGYERDTAASVVLQVCNKKPSDDEESLLPIMEQCEFILLQVVNPVHAGSYGRGKGMQLHPLKLKK